MADLLFAAVNAAAWFVIGYRVCLRRHQHWAHLCRECRRTPVDSPLAICETCFINGGPA